MRVQFQRPLEFRLSFFKVTARLQCKTKRVVGLYRLWLVFDREPKLGSGLFWLIRIHQSKSEVKTSFPRSGPQFDAVFKSIHRTFELLILRKVRTQCTVGFKAGRTFDGALERCRTHALRQAERTGEDEQQRNLPNHRLTLVSIFRMKESSGKLSTYCSMSIRAAA